MRLNDPQIAALLGVLRETRGVELDCETFVAELARFAELRVADEPWPAELRLAQEHERLCANCREELAALVELLREGA